MNNNGHAPVDNELPDDCAWGHGTPPVVLMENGQWAVVCPACMKECAVTTHPFIFAVGKDESVAIAKWNQANALLNH